MKTIVCDYFNTLVDPAKSISSSLLDQKNKRVLYLFKFLLLFLFSLFCLFLVVLLVLRLNGRRSAAGQAIINFL